MSRSISNCLRDIFLLSGRDLVEITTWLANNQGVVSLLSTRFTQALRQLAGDEIIASLNGGISIPPGLDGVWRKVDGSSGCRDGRG
jgi:hypothetical protein